MVQPLIILSTALCAIGAVLASPNPILGERHTGGYTITDVTGGKVSPDGSCGGSQGYTCSTGHCCSQYGYW